MVDFAQRNAERAGVAGAVQLRGGDALQRMPPCEQPGVMLLNPPYGERIAAAGTAGRNANERAAERAWAPAWAARPRTPTMAANSSPSWPRTGKELQRLDGLDAHARPQAAQQDAPEGIAPRADVERPHRMPLFRFDMVKGTLRERPNKAEGGGAQHAG
jgi:putative N6-adenine-specific DNA methylase